MSVPDKKVKAKGEINAALKDFDTSSRRELLTELLAELGGSNQNEGFHMRFLIAILAPLALAAIFTATLGENTLMENLDIDPKALIATLAFVVSLAAYLAGVVREVVKKLTDDMGADKKRKLKLNAAWIATAEMQLVLLGVLIIVRVAFGPVWIEQAATVFRFDNFLPIYFGLILLFLSGLHARIWLYECPFKFSKPISKGAIIPFCEKTKD